MMVDGERPCRKRLQGLRSVRVQQIKRVITILVLMGIAAILIFGPRADAPPMKDRVIIQYWEKWTGNEGAQMQEIVDWFNDTVGKDKGIYVQYLSMSSVSQKTLVSTAAGVPPDVAGLWDAQVAQFAGVDALLPLDDLAREHGITDGYYKKVYWDACHYRGKLYSMISNPAAICLLYNKQYFLDRADRLRAAGLDPNRPPQTLAELDHYAEVLDDVVVSPNGGKDIKAMGYLPMEPGWYIAFTQLWFGGSCYDEATDTIQLDSPKMIEAYTWIQSYSKRMGVKMLSDFRSGLGNVDSTQNPFLVDQVAMVQQGPWTANYIENLRPSMNRWKWDKDTERKLPYEQRKQNYAWGAAAFPSAVPGLRDVCYAPFDALVIPRGCKHPKEAFEFIAFVNRQDVMEKLCSLHCDNSPLAKVSREFIENHPNPYIDVYERLARSPNAHGVPPIAIWPVVSDELQNAATRVYMLEATPEQALKDAQARASEAYDRFREIQKKRGGVQ